MKIEELKKRDNLFLLDKNRNYHAGSEIISLLSKEFLSAEEIAKKTGREQRNVYVPLRRLEKKEVLIAFNVDEKVIWGLKKLAEKHGLIDNPEPEKQEAKEK